MSHPVPKHKPIRLECLLNLILTPAVDEITYELFSSKIYVKLDDDQDGKSLPGGDQTIQGKWEYPLAHWVFKGMIPMAATTSYPRTLIYGEDQDGTFKQLGSIDVAIGPLPAAATQIAVIQGTLWLASPSDPCPPFEFSYYATLHILGPKHVNDDGTIVASSPITNSPESQPSQTDPTVLAAQGDELFELHFTDRNVAHLTSARSFYFDAVQFTTDNDPYRADRLSKLAYILLNLFISTGDVTHLNEAIPIFENAVSSTPDGLSSKPFLLNCQGFALSSRYMRLEALSDHMLAMSAYGNAMRLTPDNHPENPWWLLDLTCNGLEVEQAIPIYMTSVRLAPDNDPSKPFLLDTLGRLALYRFSLERSDVNLNLVVTSHRDAVHLTFDDDPAKGSRLHHLAHALMTRFERLDELTDLDESITVYRRASRLADCAQPANSVYHNELADALYSRFERLGLRTDLDQAILILRDVLRSIDDDRSQRAVCLNRLGMVLSIRYEYFGTTPDLRESITFLKDAVSLPDDIDTGVMCLINLINLQHRFYQCLDDTTFLDESISALKGAAEMVPDGCRTKYMCLSCLGFLLDTRYKRFNDLTDLDEIMVVTKQAIQISGEGHRDRLSCLDRLGATYLARFERFRNIEDIDQSISVRSEGVKITPLGDLNRPGRLNFLGISFLARFVRLGNPIDLDESVHACEEAVQATAERDVNKPSRLGNLGDALLRRFEYSFNILDLDHSIQLLEEAVHLTPGNHPEKPRLLNNLCGSLRSRFKYLGTLPDDDKSIALQREALDLTPDGHPTKLDYLSNLGGCLLDHFERCGDIASINQSVSLCKEAVHLAMDAHPRKTSYLIKLGLSLHARYKANSRISDLNAAIRQFSQAATSTTGDPFSRFYAAEWWVRCNEEVAVPPLETYRCMIDLLPLLAWLGLGVLDRYRELKRIGAVIRDAATLAIHTGHYDLALEWLEEGRSIVWGQMLQLRTPIPELHDKAPDLAAQFEKLSKEMESTETNTIPLAGGDRRPQLSFEALSQRRRQLTTKWETVVRNIRKVDGMDGFLLPKRVSQLAEAASSGPVVVLNASTHHCHALILKPNYDHAIAVPLCNFTFERAQALQRKLMLIRSNVGVRQDDERAGRVAPVQGLSSDFPRLLSELWNQVVRPVLDALDIPIRATSNPSRIWWCGTGPLAFLPIHAAGLYDLGSTVDLMSKPLIQLSDIVVSSYTPSVTALLKVRKEQPSSKFQLLAVAQPSTPGQPRLPKTMLEVAEIRKHLGSHSMMELEGADATIERVIDGLSHCGWVHFACHGSQNRSDPTKSALKLEDGRLEIGRITRSVLPSTAEFAFLSACQTASGDETLPEEAVHLAAGMLFAGYGSVIATMWSIRDKDAPVVADEVYGRLLSVKQPDSTQAARALHYAVARLRQESPDISFLSWVPFIHIGR